MHDLAPLKLAKLRDPDWATAGVNPDAITCRGAVHLKTAAARAEAVAGALDLPSAGRVTNSQSLQAIWLAPGEWLVFAEDRVAADLVKRGEAHGAAAPQAGDRLLTVALGRSVDEVARLSGLPAEAIESGRTARTRLADVTVTLVGEADGSVRLVFDRTHAAQVCGWLARAT